MHFISNVSVSFFLLEKVIAVDNCRLKGPEQKQDKGHTARAVCPKFVTVLLIFLYL